MKEYNEWLDKYNNNNKTGYYSREKVLIKFYPNVYKEILKAHGESLNEKIYCYVRNITETPICANCNR